MRPNKGRCTSPLAVIDIGTNTLRLLIGCVSEGKVVRVATERAVTRLGKGLISTSRLYPEGVDKSISSLIRFKKLCETHGVKNTLAVGTSALREAEDSEAFLLSVKRKTGIDIGVISGQEEAELTLRGVLAGQDQEIGSAGQRSLIIDIGGGSTEWILKNGEPVRGSLPLGAVKLFEGFVAHDPPTLEELDTMRTIVAEGVRTSDLYSHIKSEKDSLAGRDASPRLIATGGTAATLAIIDRGLSHYDGNKIHGHNIPFPTLTKLCRRFLSMPQRERARIRGLEAERADIIIPGLLIVMTIMEMVGARNMVVSDYGLLEGLILSHRFPGR